MKEIICCKNISKAYSSKQVLSDINLSAKEGEFISIVGKSGVGKSTLLHILANIISPTSGTFKFDNENNKPILVFQHFNKSIFPWLTIEDNLKLVLNSKKNINDKIDYYLSLVGLNDVKKMYPKELSGGMLQRVSLARSFIVKPKILLLDEPFGSLDTYIKNELECDLQKICKSLNLTVILVTHDIDEAIFMSDKIFYLEKDTKDFAKKFDINFSFPRTHNATKSSLEFINLRQEIIECFQQ